MKRAVITGFGMVSPLAGSVEPSWRRLIAGEAAAGPIDKFDASDYPCRIAAAVPKANGAGGGRALIDAGAADETFNPDDWVSSKDQRRMDEFIVFGIAAAEMAFRHSGIELRSEDERERTGVLVGAGIGGLPGIETNVLALHNQGHRRVSPFFVTGSLINLVSGQVSIRLGLKGPNHAVVTACSSGAHAIGDAARLVMLGDADVMIAGGAESTISPIGIAGFCACKALTTHFNGTPERASRPYDQDRDGFLMGEGAGMVVVEEMERAKARGATIYAEIVGYGLSGDAYHVTAPAEDGGGAFRAMRMALNRAGLEPRHIDYVNAHGTSTPKGDEIEVRAVERLFGDVADGLVMSSTKSSTGHLLGAAGAVEAVFSLLAIRDGIAPPTINLDNPSVDTPINLVANAAIRRPIDTVLSNSFGFGGTNACLVLRRFDD
ncbi:MAG: beta-ketoacyl-ACP synthase II [Alphaproteobacteria bacterium]|nr:beta-ketoacyl-ACP synthase II [Alphaproteobacteria bacterium]